MMKERVTDTWKKRKMRKRWGSPVGFVYSDVEDILEHLDALGEGGSWEEVLYNILEGHHVEI
ncbi:hypothetical protein E2C01_012165 [Portunus trituberculatus]|uniref:Uncharacterized protein n=1 Tax=Portunus trituberculatus TaxID=210409 RepID=A0A5B7DDB4_PORTR|nr:hypothetical protein [Portunus trituberculatus]